MNLYRRRLFINYFNLTVSILMTVFGLFWLIWLLWTLLSNGLQWISMDVFTQITPPPG
ncbi:MAG TPA: phosphate ABC transporter permease PtsA, partial [Gammaproteobacteria bacterium]|nr:phosphate ABC transporter permease PtsA [Gammaproteobacteria bacterium]